LTKKFFDIFAYWTLLNHPRTQFLLLEARCCHELQRFAKALCKVLKTRSCMDVDNSRGAGPGRWNEEL
jgi:hypothetical protein